MKYLILIFIRIYWIIIPSGKRKSCLYKESCSRYIYRIAKTQGFKPGIKAFWRRWKTCRPGYGYLWNEDTGRFDLVLKEGTILPFEHVADGLSPSKLENSNLVI